MGESSEEGLPLKQKLGRNDGQRGKCVGIYTLKEMDAIGWVFFLCFE